MPQITLFNSKNCCPCHPGSTQIHIPDCSQNRTGGKGYAGRKITLSKPFLKQSLCPVFAGLYENGMAVWDARQSLLRRRGLLKGWQNLSVAPSLCSAKGCHPNPGVHPSRNPWRGYKLPLELHLQTGYNECLSVRDWYRRME